MTVTKNTSQNADQSARPARSRLARTATAAALSLGMLISSGASVGADQINLDPGPADPAKTLTDQGPSNGVPLPSDGVLFGEAPGRDGGAYLALRGQDGPVADPAVLAEFEVGSGFVRFIQEGDAIATVIKGDQETFRTAARASTIGELYEMVAPDRSRMPEPIAGAQHDPIDAIAGLRETYGPTIENELIIGEDDWADGCDDEEFSSWESSFGAWHGFIPGSDSFSISEHYVGGATVDDMHGYFGTIDEVWFGVCMVEGIVGSVDIQRRVYDIGYADGEGGYLYGSWQNIPGTGGLIGPGERYLYHNNSPYGPLRRTKLASIGNASVTGWEYFISGAAHDTFAPDDQYKN